MHKLDRLLLFLALAGIIFLAYMAGGAAVYYKLPPYRWIDDAVTAQQAIKEKDESIEQAERWSPIQQNPHPDVVHKPGAYEGYTLMSTGGNQAVLVDMDGHIVHQWARAFSKTWGNPTQVAAPLPDRQTLWRDVHLLPDGSLMVDFEGRGDTPYGYGLGLIDKNSELLWKYSNNVHHVFDIDADGTVYALIHGVMDTSSIHDVQFSVRSILADSVVKIDKEGKELGRVSLIEAFANSSYEDIFKEYVEGDNMTPENNFRKNSKNWDIMHSNSIVVLRADMAKAFPMFRPGQVLVSMRNMDAIGVLDFSSRKFVWVAKGSWKHQHDVEFVPDGSIMIFDNKGGYPYSRVLKYRPDTKTTEVAFAGTQEQPFYTPINGMQQRLPNGDLLLAETESGRVLEVTPKGEIVWQMYNPFTRDGKPMKVHVAARYSKDDLPFLKDATANP